MMNSSFISKGIIFFTLFYLALTSCLVSAQPTTSQPTTSQHAQTTPVTDENYSLAESQIIFQSYVNKIAAATQTNGVGVLLHNKKAADPNNHMVVRLNFDTQYSYAVLDLMHEATLTLPNTNGRYQSAWFITEEHYNPMAFNQPGTYKISQQNTGSRYVIIVIRTQVNMADPNDLAVVSKLQDEIVLSQKDRGSYTASNNWNQDEILEMRKKYQRILIEKGITSDVMFGKKGEISLENHNCGTATGFGGLTKDQAVYIMGAPDNSNPATLTLKDVPIKAFWSVTVYDKEGFPRGNTFNINSAFAKQNNNGEYVIHFGGDKSAANYLEIYDGWNYTLRMYQPTDAYFNGSWQVPVMKEIKQ
jgi:hypothetical protein